MRQLRVSAAWWCYVRDGMSAQAFIETAAELGYDGIELAPQDAWPRIADAGLTIAAFSGHASLTDGLNRAENHDRIEREINDNLALAQEWGVPTLLCFSGNRDGLADEAGAEATAAGLRRVAQAAEDAGVTLALELLNSKIDHPGYQCDATTWGLQVCRMVDSPRIKLLYDIYHMQIMEGDIIRTIAAHHDDFAHYHIAGNPGRHEPDESQELNYPAIYRALQATGYTGYLGMEFIAKGEPAASLSAAIAAVPTN
ncbi:MAG: hydroxypyruvate isomerase family protein [Thermomicrobiales bacterium]